MWISLSERSQILEPRILNASVPSDARTALRDLLVSHYGIDVTVSNKSTDNKEPDFSILLDAARSARNEAAVVKDGVR